MIGVCSCMDKVNVGGDESFVASPAMLRVNHSKFEKTQPDSSQQAGVIICDL